MANSIYLASSEIVDMMKELIGQHHPDLALVADEIALVFREKASKTGGRALLGKSGKAAPIIGILGDTNYKFILEVAADEWEDLTSRQRKALLDHLLCSCRAEEDPESGEMKYFKAVPDVAFFWDELNRWGDWRPRPEGDGPDGPSPVEEIFGRKKDDAKV